MARFVLIHGAWQAAWCWRKVAPLLHAKGHDVVTVDLPGHGRDATPPETVTMRHYVDRIAQEIRASSENAILVGHSMGGVITQAAESVPDRLEALVYIAALVPHHGRAMLEFVWAYDPAFVEQFVWAPDGRTARITAEGARRFLYNECPPGDVEPVLPLFTAEPAAPFATPMVLTDERLGRVPRFYVECLRDRAVPLSLQRSMQEGFQKVYSLDTDHSPFFSRADDLAQILHEIAARN